MMDDKKVFQVHFMLFELTFGLWEWFSLTIAEFYGYDERSLFHVYIDKMVFELDIFYIHVCFYEPEIPEWKSSEKDFADDNQEEI